MKRTIWTAVIFGLAVFTFGFGALMLWWFSGSYPSGVPGLFDYRSATWGDGLFLPVFVAALVWTNRKLPTPTGYLFRVTGENR